MDKREGSLGSLGIVRSETAVIRPALESDDSPEYVPLFYLRTGGTASTTSIKVHKREYDICTFRDFVP